MSQENVALVWSLYDAFARGDVPAVLAALDPKIEWNEAENFPCADRNPYLGPQAVLEGVFARLVSKWEGFSAQAEELLDAGHAVVAHVWKLRGGKVVKFQQYADTAQVTRAVAGTPSPA